MAVEIPKHIQKLQKYKPGKSISQVRKQFQVDRFIKLASNENPLGVSPKAKEGARLQLDHAHIYPHPRATALLERLSSFYEIEQEKIMITNGVDSLLAYILMAFTSEKDEVLTSDGSFIGIYVNANKLNRSLRTVPLKEYSYDLPALANAVSDKTKIIYIANPNNPTGTMITRKQFDEFMSRIPSSVLVILDEAYYEYAKNEVGFTNGFTMEYANAIVCRTFSKAYGMAGFRVGYGVSTKENIREVLKVKLPFEPTVIAQYAAMKALDDSDFLDQTLALNKQSMAFFESKFKELGIQYVTNSFANFFMMIFEDENQATLFAQKCLENGLILRQLGMFGFPYAVRINTGTSEENEIAFQIIEKVMAQI